MKARRGRGEEEKNATKCEGNRQRNSKWIRKHCVEEIKQNRMEGKGRRDKNEKENTEIKSKIRQRVKR